MFKKIKIENYKGINNLELNDLQQFNLLVGKNNSGKTSILESFLFISSPSTPLYPILINNLRGHYFTQPYSWMVLFNKMDIEIPISISGEIINPKEMRILTIKNLPKKNLVQSINESLEFSQSPKEFDEIIGLSLEFSISKSSRGEKKMYESRIWLGRENKLENSLPENYTETLKSIFLTPASIRTNIPRWFNQALIKKQDEKILEILKYVEPRLVNLFLGAENILYCDMGFTRLLPLSTAGEGLNNLLGIILAIYENPNGIVLIDEIENGLHYTTQKILWEAIFRAAKAFNVQVFATTHSYENVKAFSAKFTDKEDNLRLFRIENEKDEIRAIDFNNEMLSTAIESEWEVR